MPQATAQPAHAPHTASDEKTFPELTAEDLEILGKHATCRTFRDGETVFRAGDTDVDLFVVESGAIDILNPTDGDRLIATHGPGQFAGDIDLLTRRPVIVTAVARGGERGTHVLCIPGNKLREVLNTIPHISEILITAFTTRREQLQKAGVLGLKVVGPKSCRDTTVVREFLYKNFVPFTWFDMEQEGGKKVWESMGSPKKTPAIECSDGKVLLNPTLRGLAECAGVWRDCPVNEIADLAVVGGGPAGLAAAVYAASEGLRTVVLDRLGPGGQVAGSSLVENFIGFPAGLSGADLATRGVIQMLKFGARMVAPVNVDRLELGEGNEPHQLHLDCGAIARAQTVLVATGMYYRRLAATGAEKFDRQGIYYACTSVEGFIHQGQDVAVVGAGNSAGQAAMFLAERAARTVHLIVRRDNFGPGMSDYLADRIRAQDNIVIHTGAEVTEVHGNTRIDGATLTHKPDGKASRIDCRAIFVFIGAEPHIAWLPKEIARDDLGYLLTGADVVRAGAWPLSHRDPTPLETSLPRVLAGGDVRAGSTKRVGFAVGDGSLAVTCCHKIRAVSR